MKHITNTDIDNLDGKVVKKVVEDSCYVLFIFTDDTYFVVRSGYGDTIDTCEDINMYDKREVGIITEAEYQAHQNKDSTYYKNRRKQQYEELKKEFGDG